ncbi:glutaredoxin-like protein [Leptomonas seymouri]|uniref:Glutaredoxin-like protein n=1 Tax=Leptomonas seymouri TaxID=5684 RepID=A0A0N1PEY6_LEPSE|nr:glutaredoxin-like protein [Leptomonas seymouri]|eukprot:KPI87851.1 glutaredoxin-like protein [Leptomonas seymouri]
MQRVCIRLSLRPLRCGVGALTTTAALTGPLSSSSVAASLPSVNAAVPARTFCSTPLRRAAPGGAKEPTQGMGGDVEEMEETHPDFQPRMVSTDVAEDEVAAIKLDITATIRDEEIVIFIKGVPEAPMCAFSKRIVDVMEALGVEYTSFDVLAHPVVRSYVKEVSEWPTIPQMFVKGEFVGGVDIVLKMAESGDLQLLLDEKGIKHRQTKA